MGGFRLLQNTVGIQTLFRVIATVHSCTWNHGNFEQFVISFSSPYRVQCCRINNRSKDTSSLLKPWPVWFSLYISVPKTLPAGHHLCMPPGTYHPIHYSMEVTDSLFLIKPALGGWRRFTNNGSTSTLFYLPNFLKLILLSPAFGYNYTPKRWSWSLIWMAIPTELAGRKKRGPMSDVYGNDNIQIPSLRKAWSSVSKYLLHKIATLQDMVSSTRVYKSAAYCQFSESFFFLKQILEILGSAGLIKSAWTCFFRNVRYLQCLLFIQNLTAIRFLQGHKKKKQKNS